MSNSQRLGLMAAILSAVVMVTAGCAFVSVTPETATNEVGTTHTVTATLSIDFDICEIIFCPVGEVGPEAEGENITFEVIQGPNVGDHSDGDCDPNGDQLCFIPAPGQSVSWTYLGDGGPGIDYIQVCLAEPILEELLAAASEQSGLSEDEIRDMFSVDGQAEDDIEINEPEPDEGCDIVSKVWVEPTPTPTPTATPQAIEDDARPSRPNIGAGLSGLFAGQPTALPTALGPASAPVAPSQTIRPPSTGDAGLR